MNSIDDLASIGDLVGHLHRLADAAETIAACMDEDRKRRQAGERTELAYLRAQARQAGENFRMADDAAVRRMHGTWTDGDRQWHRDSEREMAAAERQVAAYEAAHPWLMEAAHA